MPDVIGLCCLTAVLASGGCAVGQPNCDNTLAQRLAGSYRAVRAASASECSSLAIDSHLNLADAIASVLPEESKNILYDVLTRLAAYPPSFRAYSTYRAVTTLIRLDPELAETVMLSMPSESSFPDYKSAALNELLFYWIPLNKKRALDTAIRGINSGAFGVRSAATLMRVSDRPAATRLFRSLLSRFPKDEAHVQDVLFMLDCTREIIEFNRTLGLQAISVIIKAMNDSTIIYRTPVIATFDFQGTKITTGDSRQTIWLQLGILLHVYDMGLYGDYQEKFDQWRPILTHVTAANAYSASRPRSITFYNEGQGSKREPPSGKRTPSSLAQALRLAAEIRNHDDRLLALVALLSHPDAEKNFGRLTQEIFDRAKKGGIGEKGIAALEDVVSACEHRADSERRDVAFSLLWKNVSRICECRSDITQNDPARCFDFYRDLAWQASINHVDLKRLGIQDVSLEARVAIIQLKKSLNYTDCRGGR